MFPPCELGCLADEKAKFYFNAAVLLTINPENRRYVSVDRVDVASRILRPRLSVYVIPARRFNAHAAAAPSKKKRRKGIERAPRSLVSRPGDPRRKKSAYPNMNKDEP
jgi:hypothetical protein